MKTLFELRPGAEVKAIDQVTSGCEWVALGDGCATEKVDGSPCAIINGELYRGYVVNAQKGMKAPIGGIPVTDRPDEKTGRWCFWVRVIDGLATDKHFAHAFKNTPWCREDGLYMAVGLHFKGNPYGLDDDFLERVGRIRHKNCPRDYFGIMDYLDAHEIEGIVWTREGGDACKVERSDFGLKWPVK